MKKSEINNKILIHIFPLINGYQVYQNILYKRTFNGLYLKGYHFFSKGDNEVGLNVHYFVLPLFVKEEVISFTFSEELIFLKKINFFKKIKMVWWDVRKENQDSTFKLIYDAIIKQGEPYLNSIQNAEGFYKKFNSEKKDNIRVFEAIAYSSILFKDISSQNDLLRRLIKLTSEEEDTHTEWIPQIAKDANLLLNIPSIPQRVEILKSWANETIKNLKLPELLPIK